MPKYPSLSTQTMDTAAMLYTKNVPNEQIMQLCNIRGSSLKRIIKGYEASEKADRVELLRLSGESMVVAEWACARCGISVSQLTRTVNDEDKAEPKAEAKQEKKPEPDNTAFAFAAMMESMKQLAAAIDNIDKRLATMQMTQQGMRGELGEHTKKLVEAIHVEGDIISKENERIIDLLGGIKMNTKKKPYREVDT